MKKDSPNIILASGSKARQTMLSNAGIKFKSIPADIDEEALSLEYSAQKSDAPFITNKLAEAKALHISKQYPEDLVIGSDQTLEFEGSILSKAKDNVDAEKKLKLLRGKTHTLCSAVCIAHNNNIVFSCDDHADLTMHDFDDEFLQTYMDKESDALTACVGAYKIEGIGGAWLFSSVEGDFFTIMGMPLRPLVTFLQNTYGIAP